MSSDNEHDEDIALFRQAMSDINRTHKNYTQQKQRRPIDREILSVYKAPKVRTATTINERPTVDETDQGDSVLFVRSGLQRKVIKRLKRGDYPYESVLDLHGMRLHEVEILLTEFLSEARQTCASCVLIIHGKGYHSENSKGVLKPFTINWLKQCSDIKAFCSANQRDGGTGAVYVLLKRGSSE